MANAFTFGVGFKADTKALVESIKVFSGNLKNNPLNLKIALPDLKTTNAQKALDGIKKQAEIIDSVIVKTRTMETVSGKAITFITGMTTKWRDALGAVHTTYTKLDSTLKNLDKNVATFDAMGKKAVEWANRAEQMGKKEKEAIQSTSAALREKIAEFKKLAEAGQITKANKLVPEIAALNKNFNESVDAAKRSAEGVKSWSTRIGDAFKQTVAYAASLGLLRQAQRLLADGLRYVIELNKEMINIQVLQAEGARTPEEINSLADSFNRLAKEMGTTTLEIAKGSVEWLRQGKSLAETATLLRATTMLAKLGNLSAAESTDYLTSTLNSYRMAANEAIGVVDKLIAVDNASATSAGELATALRYSAASADQAGVSLDQLISYVGVVSSVTRQNAEMIGQAMKTIFTRMQDIKAGAIDEDGLGINNVAIALERVDIQLMESSTEFRGMGGVLEELAAKWGTLNEVEQANIAKSIAGVRQANMFNVLMGNMADALRLQKLEFSAGGLASQRYEIYLKGVEAALNEVKSSLQAVWQDGIKNGFIVQILKATSSIIKFIDSVGGLKTVIIALGVSFTLLKLPALIPLIMAAWRGFQLVAAGAATASQAITAFGVVTGTATTIATGGITLIVAALALIAYGIYYATQAVQRHQKAWEELAQTASDSSSALADAQGSIDKIKSLWGEMDVLRAKTALTSDETKRLYEIYKEIYDLSGGIVSGTWDDQLNFTISENALLTETLVLLDEELQIKKDIALQDAKAAIEAGNRVAVDNAKEAERLSAIVAAGVQTGYTDDSGWITIGQVTQKDVNEAQRALNEIQLANVQFARDAVAVYASLQTEKERLEFESGLKSKAAQDAINDYNAEQARLTQVKIRDAALRQLENYRRAQKGLPPLVDYGAVLTKTDALKKDLDDLAAIKKRVADTGIMSAEDFTRLDGFGITAENVEGKWVIADGEIRAAIMRMKDALGYADMPADVQKLFDSLINVTMAAGEGKDAIELLGDATKSATDLMQEQSDNNEISAETVLDLVNKHSDLLRYISYENGAFQLSSNELEKNSRKTLEKALADNQLALAEANLRIRLRLNTEEMIKQKAAAENNITGIQAMLDMLNAASLPGGGSGGSGGDPYAAQKKATQEEYDLRIERAEKEKAALKQKLEDYKKIIDARKALLKSMKEEADYQDTLRDKSHTLAKVQNELLAISLDNSEEAKATRLKLEEELAKAKEDLDKTQTDRAYDLQMDALDREYKAYEDMINGQIDLIDKFIEGLKEALKGILKNMDKKGAAGSSTGSTATVAPHYMRDSKGNWIIDEAKNKAHGDYKGAEGGLVTGGTPGRDSVNALLMPGEFVLRKRIVDSLGIGALNKMNKSSVNNSFGGVSMPITVMGNLDKSVMPDLERMADKVLEKLNSTLYKRGISRATNQYSG